MQHLGGKAMKTLLIIGAAVGVGLLSGSALASAPSSWSIGLGKETAGAPGWLLLAGDPNHVHVDGPAGLNFDGENGRPGYGHGDKNHFEPDTGEHDGPPGQDPEG